MNALKEFSDDDDCEDIVRVSATVRAVQENCFVREYKDSNLCMNDGDDGVSLVSYTVDTNPESKPPGPAYPKELLVLFKQDNVICPVIVPQVEIHNDSEVYQPGQDGVLVVFRQYAQEQGWYLPNKTEPEEDDEEEAIEE